MTTESKRSKLANAHLRNGTLKTQAAALQREIHGLNTDLDELLKEFSKHKPHAHFCVEWDGMLIWDGRPEMDACSCFAAEDSDV